MYEDDLYSPRRHGSGPSREGSNTPLSSHDLVSAVGRDDLQLVRTLLESLADPNFVDDHGETPLFEAVAIRNLDIVAALLQWGADPGKRSQDGMVPCELTTDKSIITLLAMFQNREVSISSKELMLAEMSPRTASEFKDFLESRKRRSPRPREVEQDFLDTRRRRPQRPREDLGATVLSGFYQDRAESGCRVEIASIVASGPPPADLGATVLSGFYQDDDPREAAKPPPPAAPLPTPQTSQMFDEPFPKLENQVIVDTLLVERDILAASKQIFEVVKAKRCKVYAKPDLESTVMMKKSRGGFVFGVEMTMNGWLRLYDRAEGWMLTDMQGIDGQREVLRPKELALDLVVRSYRSQGICLLEVCAPEVATFDVPSYEGSVLSIRYLGEYVFAQSQSFNGWLRLMGDEGWVYCRGAANTMAVKIVDDQLETDEVDLSALCDVWRAARKEARGRLQQHTMGALKQLSEDSLGVVYHRLAACRCGKLEDYLALGLTADEMKLPRIHISRRLFVLVMLERLRSEAILRDVSKLTLSEGLPLLREVVGVLEFERPTGVTIYNFGPDSTVYDSDTGRVFGIWNQETQQILGMTYMSGFFGSRQASVAGGDGKEVYSRELTIDGVREHLMPPDPARGDAEEAEDCSMQADSSIGAKQGAKKDWLNHAMDLMKDNQLVAAVTALDNAMLEYREKNTVDLGIERDILMLRATCFTMLDEFEDALRDTDRLMWYDNILPPSCRHHYSTGVAEGEVQDLRRTIFKSRMGRRQERPAHVVRRRPSESSFAGID